MFRRYVVPVLASIVFLVSTSMLAAAQNGQVRGRVTLKQADGAVVPAANAIVDVFRWDLPGQYELKTSKNGEFVHAGLPLQGTFVVSVSMPGAQPYYLPGVRPGRDEDIKIELSAGDGRRLTRDDVKALIAKGSGSATPAAGASAEDKAKREEAIKKNAEIEESNKKIANSNDVIQRTFKAGNDAFSAKNYDLAITSYDEGINAAPDHPGVPALLANKILALRRRAEDNYNGAIKNPDKDAQNKGFESARADWRVANDASSKLVTLLKARPAATDPTEATQQKAELYRALKQRAEVMKLFVPKVDATQADAGLTAYQEYIAAEPDPATKAKAQVDAAKMLLDAGAGDKAFAEYQKILATTPDSVEANLGAGLSLFNIGDKARYQEAANFLQRFVDLAPDTNPDKADAKSTLAYLKSAENVVPEKTSTPRRTRRP